MFRSSAAATAAAIPPPAPSTETEATCAEPANVVADMTTAAAAPKCDARASTPNEAPSANAAGKSVAAIRKPLRIPLPKDARFLTVAAHAHRAPLPRPVAGVVDESPAARVRPARLQALPAAVCHRLGRSSEDAAERTAHPVLPRHETDRAVGEGHREAGATTR